MHADSRSGPLPLAEALVEWSDPALVQAVRDAEKPFSAAELDALDTRLAEHFALARRIRGLDPYLKTDADPRVAALFAAWQKLAMGLVLMALRGEVLLLGIQTKPDTHSRSIGLDVGSQLTWLSARSNTAQQGDHVFSHMTARRAPPDPLDVLRKDMNVLPEGRGLELKDALIAWGDLNLVKAVRRIERRIVDVLRNPLKWPRLFHPSQAPAERCALEADDIMAPAEKLGAAWKALHQDARRKIERDEWLVWGVETWPFTETERRQLPSVWATEFWFDIEANRINVVQFNRTVRTYTAIRITRPVACSTPESSAPVPGEEAGSAPADDILEREGAAAQAAVDERYEAAEAAVPKSRGRRPFPLDAMVDIAVELGGAPWGSHKLAAFHLRKAFVDRFPEVRPPAERTIQDHVPEIYARQARKPAPQKT